MTPSTSIEPELTSMLAAFETSARVELAISRHPDAAIRRLVEGIHLQRERLAQDLRSYLYRTTRAPDAGARARASAPDAGSRSFFRSGAGSDRRLPGHP
jgi:hypothetical protein